MKYIRLQRINRSESCYDKECEIVVINIVGKGSNVELVNGRPETVDGRLEKKIRVYAFLDRQSGWFSLAAFYFRRKI